VLEVDGSTALGIYTADTHTFTGSIFYDSPTSGASTDSVLTWDADTKEVRMRDASFYGGGGTDTWAVNVLMLNAASTTDGNTQYFGNYAAAWHTSATVYAIPIIRSCTLTGAAVRGYAQTAGTDEMWAVYVRVNNTTDHLIDSIGVNTNERIWSNNSLNVSLSPGDYVNIKVVCPTWSTNPANLIMAGYLIFKN
jgi:hypothetical protein